MFVGVGERGFVRAPEDSEMAEFADATGQAVRDVAQRVGVGHVAEHHGDELGPAFEAFRAFFRLVFLDQPLKFRAGEVLK